MLLLKAAVMGVVEGLTEFLPISSTGHLILAGSLLNFTGDVVKVFEIAIQTGAMFAIIWEYRQRFFGTLGGLGRDPQANRFFLNVMIAFVPAVVLGLTLGGIIKEHLFSPVPVATAFIVGGLIILWVERRHHRRYGEADLAGTRTARVETVDDMTPLDALKVGLVQCAMRRADSGHQPFRLHHHRRDDVRPVTQGGHRVQLLSGRADADGRRRVFVAEEPRPAALV